MKHRCHFDHKYTQAHMHFLFTTCISPSVPVAPATQMWCHNTPALLITSRALPCPRSTLMSHLQTLFWHFGNLLALMWANIWLKLYGRWWRRSCWLGLLFWTHVSQGVRASSHAFITHRFAGCFRNAKINVNKFKGKTEGGCHLLASLHYHSASQMLDKLHGNTTNLWWK